MPEYQHPGVFVEEIAKGPLPIEGVPTGTAAFVGETERGATLPRLVTSLRDYAQWFGGVDRPDRFLPHALGGFFENGGKRAFVCRVVPAASTPAEADIGAGFILRAVGAGSWGRRIFTRIEDASPLPARPDGTVPPTGFRLRLAWFSEPPVGDPRDWFDGVHGAPRPAYVEDFDHLLVDEDAPGYFGAQLTALSALVTLTRGSDAAPDARPPNGFAQLAQGGIDGASPPAVDDFVGNASELRGLAALALAPYREVASVCAPGASHAVAKAVVGHCEQQQRFAVVDPERGVDATAFDARAAVADSQCAALYWPWLVVAHPRTGAPTTVPPGGHVLGLYARTDAERGVFKAPANEVLRGVIGLAEDVNDQRQSVLSPRGINVIRRFGGRGIRVWGARTLSTEGQWKYVNVRRLLTFLERSIAEGLQWSVFERNDERLWTRVGESVRFFLHACWRDGALFGGTEREAFFVRCDRTTMTQDDILSGRLVCEIGVAPARPAEFVVFRIFANAAAMAP